LQFDLYGWVGFFQVKAGGAKHLQVLAYSTSGYSDSDERINGRLSANYTSSYDR